jgi:hypothetical protein
MRNKYGAIKTEVNGIVFDSKIEAKHYVQLQEQKESGAIKDLELQPKFLLQPGFKKNGKTFRAIHYIADFKVINHDGSIEIIDVKGMETDTFKIKRKMFEDKFPELSLSIVKEGAVSSGSTKRKAREPNKRNDRISSEERAERKAKSRERRNLRARI